MLIVAIAVLALGARGAVLTNLQVERLSSPLGVDVATPLLSWELANTAALRENPYAAQQTFHVTVLAGTTVFWDSGVVQSSNLFTLYNGSSLTSDTVYTWTLVVGQSSGFLQASSTFHTGFMTGASEWSAQWLSMPNTQSSLVRGPFLCTADTTRVTAFVVGIGYNEVWINGQKADPQRVLDGPRTDYTKRSFYTTFDLTSLTSVGSNILGVMVGQGWFGQTNVLAEVHVHSSNGSVVVFPSSAAWVYSQSPITNASVYNGEFYDSRLEQPEWSTVEFLVNASLWFPCNVVAKVAAIVSSQLQQPIVVAEEFVALDVFEPASGVFVYDLGQNIAGFVRLNIPFCAAGTVVRLRHAELLQHPPYGPVTGAIYTDNLRSAQATDHYVCSGNINGEVYQPRFTYHGFRFVEITGLPTPAALADVVGLFCHSDVRKATSLTFDKDLLNKIHHNIVYGALANLVGYPSDCDQRDERQGWTGDASLAVELEMINFDAAALFSSWSLSMVDDQTADGSIPPVIPGSGDSPDPAWTTAFPTLVHGIYHAYGDAALVARRYASLSAYHSWLLHQYNVSKNGLATIFTEWGDWCPPPPAGKVSGNIVSSATYLHDFGIMADMAAVLGHTADAAAYQAFLDKITIEFNQVWFDNTTNKYLDGGQAASSFALFFELVPAANTAAVLAGIEMDIVGAQGGHLTTGIVSLRYLLEGLANYGRADLALTMLLQTTYPSFGYQIYNQYEPATSVWELWDSDSEGPGMNSRNHIMFGSPDTFLWKVLLGLDMAPGTHSYANITVKPQAALYWQNPNISERVMHASGSLHSVRGVVSVDWTFNAGPSSTCGTVAENGDISLGCSSGTISAVTFACFGNAPPAGWQCPLPSGHGSCACANSSVSVVQSLCLGKSSCTVTASDTLFGDPCFQTVKALAASVACSTAQGSPLFVLSVTIPLTSVASVFVPIVTNQTSFVVTESGTAVFANGVFVPGVPGVVGAVVSGAYVAVSTLSGTYSFVLLA